MTQTFIAADGTRCTSQEVVDNYNRQLVDATYMRMSKRVTPKLARLFYSRWCTPARYELNRYYPATYATELSDVKRRIIRSVAHRAKRRGWYIWRFKNVLYVETPYGQCSWHMYVGGYILKCDLRWFRQFPERSDLCWSGIRNSDVVIRAILGESRIQRSLSALNEHVVNPRA